MIPVEYRITHSINCGCHITPKTPGSVSTGHHSPKHTMSCIMQAPVSAPKLVTYWFHYITKPVHSYKFIVVVILEFGNTKTVVRWHKVNATCCTWHLITHFTHPESSCSWPILNVIVLLRAACLPFISLEYIGQWLAQLAVLHVWVMPLLTFFTKWVHCQI